MKSLKIYNDVHRDLKVEAAKSGRNTSNLGSELLRVALNQLKSGKIKTEKLPTEESATK
jgi:plasmid stability protein